MAWEAWLLATRSRAEVVVRERISSVKKAVKKARKDIEKHIMKLKEEIEKVSSLIKRSRDVEEAKHKLVEELINVRASLEEAVREGEQALREAIDILNDLEDKQIRLDILMRKAQVEAAVGSLDRAHELIREAEHVRDEALNRLQYIIVALEKRSRALVELAGHLENLLRRAQHELMLVIRAGVELRDEELVHLARTCRAKGLGKGIFIITSKRALFSSFSGVKRLELRREQIEDVRTFRGFLGLRKKLVLTFSGPPGRGELVLWCNREDAKDILAELAERQRSEHEAQAGGLHTGHRGAHSDRRPHDSLT